MRLQNGFGSVVFLGKKRRRPYGARVTVGWTDEGKQVYKYIGYFEKKTDAFTCLVAYNQKPFDISKRKMTFAEIYEAWSERHYEKVSNSSKIVYNSAYNKCKPLYSMQFAEIKTTHLQAVIDEHRNSSSVRIVKVIVAQLYDYAIKNDIVEKDYSQYIELPKKEKKKDKTPFTFEEIKTLWDNKDYEFVDMLLILLYTGLRISELLDIQISNIDIENRFMIGGLKTQAGINRVIPIHKDILPLIEKQITPNKKYLYETKLGKKLLYSNYGTKLNGTIKHFKMDHTLHETRHTFISQADRLGIDKILIKRIVGHSTKDITEHYTHKNNEDLVQAIDLFNYPL